MELGKPDCSKQETRDGRTKNGTLAFVQADFTRYGDQEVVDVESQTGDTHSRLLSGEEMSVQGEGEGGAYLNGEFCGHVERSDCIVRHVRTCLSCRIGIGVRFLVCGQGS